MRVPVCVVAVWCIACGGSQPVPDPPPVADADPPAAVASHRTEIEVRQEAACEQAGRRLTRCAVEDAERQPPEERAAADIKRTAPILTREFIKQCMAKPMSSRQVHVYEVCMREETECEPLLTCLDNARPVP